MAFDFVNYFIDGLCASGRQISVNFYSLNERKLLTNLLPGTEVKTNTQYKFDADDVALATGILNTIQKKDFVFFLVFQKEFLNLISPADKILQSRDLGFREAMPVIQEVQSNVRNLRTHSSFSRLWKTSDKILRETVTNEVTSNPSQSRPNRNKRRSSSLAVYLVTERIGERNSDIDIEIESFYAVIDIFLREMKNRFDDNIELLTAISEVSELILEKLKPLRKIGIELSSEEELLVAKGYIDKKKHHDEERQRNDDTSFKNRFNVLKELYIVKDALPKVYNLFSTIDTFCCSTSICECSFSTLERMGTKKRISMDKERLRHLSFLAFESKTLSTIPIDDILKTFDENPKRRVQFY